MAGHDEFASSSFEDALEALETDAARHPCEVCGRRPRERKRRRDGSWYYYARCRECRRQTLEPVLRSQELAITDQRFPYLFQLFYSHLCKLKQRNWEGAPKKAVLNRLKFLVAIVKE